MPRKIGNPKGEFFRSLPQFSQYFHQQKTGSNMCKLSTKSISKTDNNAPTLNPLNALICTSHFVHA